MEENPGKLKYMAAGNSTSLYHEVWGRSVGGGGVEKKKKKEERKSKLLTKTPKP